MGEWMGKWTDVAAVELPSSGRTVSARGCPAGTCVTVTRVNNRAMVRTNETAFVRVIGRPPFVRNGGFVHGAPDQHLVLISRDTKRNHSVLLGTHVIVSQLAPTVQEMVAFDCTRGRAIKCRRQEMQP